MKQQIFNADKSNGFYCTFKWHRCLYFLYIGFSACTFTGNYKLELRDGGGNLTTDLNAIRGTTQTTNSILDVAGYMPELKAEDFLVVY